MTTINGESGEVVSASPHRAAEPHPSEHDPDAATVARACRVLASLDVTHTVLGHVSCRVPGSDSMLIRAKGPTEVGVRFARGRDIIRVDFDGKKLTDADGLWPPGEVFIHSWLYRLNPEVNSVVHVHPKSAVVLTICDKELFPVYGAYGSGARLSFEGIPVYPKSTIIADDEAGEQFARFVDGRPVVLMRGHGATITGKSVEEATVRAMALNEYLDIVHLAYQIGGPNRLPDDEIESGRRIEPPHPERGLPVGDDRTRVFWRYYCKLAGQFND